jgi:hypothetical protein
MVHFLPSVAEDPKFTCQGLVEGQVPQRSILGWIWILQRNLVRDPSYKDSSCV